MLHIVCISRYPKTNILYAAIINSFLFTTEAIISDLIFFVVIRNTMDEIMQATTVYLLSADFIILLFNIRFEQ
ncbi:MAG: hypothetical protein RL662_869 [Bacteroidota bacterium]|jgi:hypothetical protein